VNDIPAHTPAPHVRQTKADLLREVIELRNKVIELNAIMEAKQRLLDMARADRRKAWQDQEHAHACALSTLRKLHLTALVAGVLCGGYIVIGLTLLTSSMGGGQ
jgi:hypothetical protein